MNILFPILFFGFPFVVAIKLCGWQVAVSFLIAILAVPFFAVLLTHLLDVALEKQRFDFKGCLAITGIFAIPGVPLYFLIILPLYFFIQKFNVNFYLAFPLVVSLMMLVTVKLLEKEPQPFWFYLLVTGCGIAHALLIAWLIVRLKSLSV